MALSDLFAAPFDKKELFASPFDKKDLFAQPFQSAPASAATSPTPAGAGAQRDAIAGAVLRNQPSGYNPANDPNSPERQQQLRNDPAGYNAWLAVHNSMQGGGGGASSGGGGSSFGGGGGNPADNPNSPERQQQLRNDPTGYNAWLAVHNSLQGGGGGGGSQMQAGQGGGSQMQAGQGGGPSQYSPGGVYLGGGNVPAPSSNIPPWWEPQAVTGGGAPSARLPWWMYGFYMDPNNVGVGGGSGGLGGIGGAQGHGIAGGMAGSIGTQSGNIGSPAGAVGDW